MGKLFSVIGPSGVGKTAFVQALSKYPQFIAAYEQHDGRPFQNLFKTDERYALPNQLDYLILRAEQELTLRASTRIGLVDGGLDLDFQGFTGLFHSRGWLTDTEYDLCRRLYTLIRSLLPPADLIVVLSASPQIIRARLASRARINIASARDIESITSFLENWLKSLPEEKILRLDVSNEGLDYSTSIRTLLNYAGLEGT